MFSNQSPYMSPNSKTVLSIFFILVFFTSLTTYANGNTRFYEQATDKSLGEILEDIEFALTERNLRVLNKLHIGAGIQTRGYEDYPDYEIILYCNLDFARKMLDYMPELINSCPGKITVREKNAGYLISATLWPEDNIHPDLERLMYNMNVIVREIVDFAALEWLDIHNEKD